MGIEITGLDELRAKLRLLDERIRTVAAKRAVHAGASVIASAMQESAPERTLTPSGDALPPGALRADIKVRERADRDGFVTASIGPGKRTGYVARFVEYGHRQVARDITGAVHVAGGGAGRVVGHVPARPFLRPAFERARGKAIEEFKAVLQEEIREELK